MTERKRTVGRRGKRSKRGGPSFRRWIPLVPVQVYEIERLPTTARVSGLVQISCSSNVKGWHVGIIGFIKEEKKDVGRVISISRDVRSAATNDMATAPGRIQED